MISKDDINIPALQDRVKKIITDPAAEWRVIEPEPTTIEELYKGYIVPLAAIPAIATLIGYTMIGVTMPFVGTYRWGLIPALVHAVVSFLFMLATVYIAALVVSKLAPNFESKMDDRQAMKLVAYSYTPSWIAGILMVIPLLSPLMILAGLYAIYLFYLGLPVMMKTPPARVLPYMVISAVVIIVVSLVLGLIAASISGAAMVTGRL